MLDSRLEIEKQDNRKYSSETKKAEPFLTLPFEEEKRDDLLFKSLHFYLNEIDIIDIRIIAYNPPSPIQDRLHCYSFWILSPLW
jgi:hypothetical protein